MAREVKRRVRVETGQAERSLDNLGRKFRQTGQSADTLSQKAGAQGGGLKEGFRQAAQGSGLFGGALGKLMSIGTGVGAVFVGVQVAMRAVGAAAREMGKWISEAISFQKQTFQLRMLTGSMREARSVMLQLTEGALAVDHVFGSDAVVAAYRKLHNYTNGALASANVVKLLGDVAARTGNDIGALADTMGRAWQMIAAGEDLGRVAFPLMNMNLVTREFVNELQQMKDAGASAADIFMTLYAEIERVHRGGVDQLAGSLDDLRKQTADLASQTRRRFGEMFEPGLSGWERFKQRILREGKLVADVLDRIGSPRWFEMPQAYVARGIKAEREIIREQESEDTRLLMMPVHVLRDEPDEALQRALHVARGAYESSGAPMFAVRARQIEQILSERDAERSAEEIAEAERRNQARDLDDYRREREAKREADRWAGMSSDELRDEAQRHMDRFVLEGRGEDALKAERLRDMAVERAAEEREAEAKAARELREAEEALARRIRAAMDAHEVRDKSAREQAEIYQRRADQARGEVAGILGDAGQDRLQEAMAGGLDLSALNAALDAGLDLSPEAQKALEEAILRALAAEDQARAARMRADAEDDAGRRARDQFDRDREDFRLRQMRPRDEIAEREARMGAMIAERDQTPWDADPSRRADLERRILSEERRIAALLGAAQEPTAAPRRGIGDFTEDLQRQPGIAAGAGLSMTRNAMRFRQMLTGSATTSVAESFRSRLIEGQLSSGEMERGLGRRTGDDLIRLQIQQDAVRNDLLREQLERSGLQ